MKKYSVAVSPGLEHHRKEILVRQKMKAIFALPHWIFETVEGFATDQRQFEVSGGCWKDVLKVLQMQKGLNPQTFVQATRMTFFLDFLGHANKLSGYSVQVAFMWPGRNSRPFSFTIFFDPDGNYTSIFRD